jgi:DNA-binding response OmpR family regulator
VTVLLVAADWKLRALLRAELIEAGLDVLAVETWADAEALLLAHGLPRLLVLAVEEDRNPRAILEAARVLVPPSRTLVLTAASVLTVEDIRSLGFVNAISRPYRLGDIVERVRGALFPLPRNEGEG